MLSGTEEAGAGMKDIEINEQDEQIFYGLRTISNDKHLKKDTEELMRQVYRASGGTSMNSYIVFMQDFYQDEGEYQLFVGGKSYHSNLEKLIVMKGSYAKAEVACKLMQSWNMAVHDTKHYIYTKWMEKQPYRSCHTEYILFQEHTNAKKRIFDLYIQVEHQ